MTESVVNIASRTKKFPAVDQMVAGIGAGSEAAEKRKIIQISSSQVINTNSGIRDQTIVALCNDGTVWAFDTDNRGFWVRIPSLPEMSL